ncbi:MAG: nuclear transport factor 2 family protein [Myxococcales bacterium]|nr:nuclear transport factor 2 family protein [Myxococcales bacterium]
MPTITASVAHAFATSWIAAWNLHDLDAILHHYREDFEFSSPLIVKIANEPSGMLRGKSAVRAYWSKGLALIPNLHFELLHVLSGIDALTLVYRGHRGVVAESFWLDEHGQVYKASACYE